MAVQISKEELGKQIMQRVRETTEMLNNKAAFAKRRRCLSDSATVYEAGLKKGGQKAAEAALEEHLNRKAA